MNNQIGLPKSTQATIIDNDREETKPKMNNGWKKFLARVGNWLAHKDKDKWLKDMRGNLSLVATVISTMTFQAAINPPGGVRPSKDHGEVKCPKNATVIDPCPGEAILAVVFPTDYFQFLLWNTICFVASLSVCLLLLSGLPLNHRFPMWLLSIGTCITITSLALTYMNAVSMVTPDPVWGETSNVLKKMLFIWIGLLGLLGFVLTLRFVVWGVNIFVNKGERSISSSKKYKEGNFSQ